MISPFQLFGLLSISSIFCAMMYSEYTVKQSDLSVYSIAIPISAVIIGVICAVLIRFNNKNPDCNIIKIIQIKKPALSGIFSGFYMLYFIALSVSSLVLFSLMLGNFISQKLPFNAFFVITAAGVYYSASKGIAALGRTSAVFYIITTILVATSCFSIGFRINPLNYSYLFLEDGGGLFDNILHITALNSAVPALFILNGRIKGNVKKTVYLWVVVSNLTSLALTVIFLGVLGEYSYMTPYPFYTGAQLIEFGAFQRLDAVYISLWTIGMFVNLSLSFYCLRETIQSSFCADKCRFINPLSAAAVVLLSLASVHFNRVRDLFLNTKVLFVIFLAASAAFPLIAVFSLGKRKISSLAAKTAALSIVGLLIVPLLSGCGETQLQDRMLVKGVGIDKHDDNFAVSVQYIDNYSDNDKQQNKYLKVIGKSVGEAVGKIKNSSGSEPFLGQNVAVVVGMETAKENMKEILDYFVRYSDTRPTASLYVSETTAEDILCATADGQLIPIDHLTLISPSQSKNDNFFTVLNYINQSQSPMETPTATVLKFADNAIRMSTAAYFAKDGSSGLLDENDFTAYKTLIGIENGTVLCFDGITAAVTDCKTKIKADDNNGKLYFDSECRLDLTVIENPENVPEGKTAEIFSKNIERIIEESEEKMLREKSCDIYSFGKHLLFDDYKKYYENPEAYRNALRGSELLVDVDCRIVKTAR